MVYTALDLPATRDVRALVEKAIAPDWKSYSGETEFKDRETFIKHVIVLGESIPDLRWKVKEMLVSGNRVIVRSIASGTPQGKFMGVPVDKHKFFSIMAIDIHTIANGKGIAVHHVEDWASALRQLKP